MTSGMVAQGVRLLTGASLQQHLPMPNGVRIYLANHTSHLDFIVIWAVLPAALRCRARPVAAADYWSKGAIRRSLASRLFRAVLVERESVSRENNPLNKMRDVLAGGEDLILFPEGTRSSDGAMRAFKPGIFHLVRRFPQVELIPVHLENLNRILPKGEILPVPVLGNVNFGPPLAPLADGETKTEFLERAREAVSTLGTTNL